MAVRPSAKATLVCLMAIAATLTNAQPSRQTVAAWRADIAFMDSTMRLVHPAPNHRVSRETFDAAFRSLNRDVPTLTDKQIATRMIGIGSLLNDGHSRLTAAAPLFSRNSVFPLRMERFVDGIHIIATRPGDASIAGARVLRIGSLSAQAAWDSLESFSSGDNQFSRMSNVPLLLANAEMLHALGITPAQELPLAVLAVNGDTLRRSVAAIAEPVAGAWLSDGWKGPGGATHSTFGNHRDGRLVESHRNLAYWYAERGTALYVQVNSIADSRDTVSLGSSRGVVTFAGFTQRVMERIDAGGVERVILDVRYNGGGNNALVRPFVSGIAARPAINIRGRFFVITGRATYSAAMNFVSMLEDRTEAIFVGEPPGGSPQHYGDAVGFTLPNSKLVLRVSTVHWTTGVPTTDVREVMEPDISAPPLYSDFREGADAPLRAIDAFSETAVLADALKARYRAGSLDAAFSYYDSLHSRTVSRDANHPWNSDVQQLLEFSYGIIPMAKSRDDVFRAFILVTDRFPVSHQAWYERGRVFAFVNEWANVRSAYAKARTLRPNNAVIRRANEAALRR